MQRETVVILDFGAQYNQLIARRVRECNIYCVIMPYNTPISKIKAVNPKAIILTGGPSSVAHRDSPKCSKEIFEIGIPILGICYGMQLMGYLLGGKVGRTKKREYGHTELIIDKKGIELSTKSIPFGAVIEASGNRKISHKPILNHSFGIIENIFDEKMNEFTKINRILIRKGTSLPCSFEKIIYTQEPKYKIMITQGEDSDPDFVDIIKEFMVTADFLSEKKYATKVNISCDNNSIVSFSINSRNNKFNIIEAGNADYV